MSPATDPASRSLSPLANPEPARGRKLGILISGSPQAAGFQHGVRLAAAALKAGVRVYLYCIDDAILGLTDPGLLSLQGQGLNLYGCAYAAQKRNLAMTGPAAFAGLSVVNDLMTATDRFVAFN